MKSTTIRRWSFIHTWTSLICTVFLLMLALTKTSNTKEIQRMFYTY